MEVFIMNGTEIVNTLSKAIDMLANKMSVPANRLYKIMQQQLKFDMYITTIHIIMFSIMLVIALIFGKKFIKSLTTKDSYYYKNWHDTYAQDATMVSATILVSVIVLLVIILVCSVSNLIQIKISPEYYIFENYIEPLMNR